MKKKHVALMIRGLNFGGAERFTADLSLALEKKGYDVHLLVLDASETVYKHGGKLHNLSYYYKKESKIMPFLFFQHLIKARQFKKKYSIDTCISVMEFSNLINLLSYSGEQIIPTIHNFKLQYEMTPSLKDSFIEWLFTKQLSKVSDIVVVSKAIKKKLEGLYSIDNNKIRCIYNACDVERIAKDSLEPVGDTLKAFMTDCTFVSVSRLVEQKSIHKLIQAFALVASENEDARLVIVGSGHLKADLKRLASSLNISEKIMFTGFKSNPFPIVKQARAFVLSSHFEGFGLVLTEAMSCGTPVISVDCACGPREIIAPETEGVASGVELCEYGILTSPHDGEWTDPPDKSVYDLANAMSMMIKDDSLYKRYKEQSLKRAKDFAPERIYSQWFALLEEGKKN